MMDVEISAAGLGSLADQERLRPLLENLPGVKSVSFLEGRIAVRYDAERTANVRLCEVMMQAGFTSTDVKTAPGLPARRPLRQRTGPRTGHHHPAQSAQDRHRDPAQLSSPRLCGSAPRCGVALPREAVAAHPAAVLERLSLPGTLRFDAAPPQPGLPRDRCCPRHPKNNGEKEPCLPIARKPPP